MLQHPVVQAILANAAIFGVVLMSVPFVLLWERVFFGWLTQRPGPNRVGPRGLLQSFADAIKLLQKEDFAPEHADKLLFTLAPVLFLVPVLLIYAVVPFAVYGDRPLMIADLRTGLFYMVAVTSVHTAALLMAGWGSNNKYSLMGGIRGVAQAVSYEIPLVMAFLGVIMLSGSMSTVDLVRYQATHGWLFLMQPVAFVAYVICAIAEVNRAPFDIPEAESELISGYNTEYSGFRFAMFFMSEYTALMAISAIATVAFLGGWLSPFSAFGLDHWITHQWPLLGVFWSGGWFLLKVWGLITFAIWLRFTVPRLRADQLMGFAWKFLLPVLLANVLFTALLGLLPLADPYGAWVEGVAMWAVVLVLLARGAAAARQGQPGGRAVVYQ